MTFSVEQDGCRAGQKVSAPDGIVESLLFMEPRRTTVGAHVHLHLGPRLADVNVNSPGNPAVNNVLVSMFSYLHHSGLEIWQIWSRCAI